MGGDGGFVRCRRRFFAKVVPQADVAVVVDAFADGLPLERVDKTVALRLRIADAGVLRLAFVVAVEVVVGASVHAEEGPCPCSRGAAAPVVDAENVAVGVDVAVLLEAAVRVAAGAVPPEGVAVVQRFFPQGVVGLLRAAGHVGDVVVAAVVQPRGEMLTDEIAVACVKRFESSFFHKFERADGLVAAAAFVRFIDGVDAVVRPAVLFRHRADGLQKLVEASDEFRRVVGGFGLQRAHQMTVDGLERNDGDAGEANLAVELHDTAETGHVDMEVLSVVSDSCAAEWIHHQGVHAMFAEHAHFAEDFVIGVILTVPTLSVRIEAERHVMVFRKGEVIDRQFVCRDRLAIQKDWRGIDARLGVRRDGRANAILCRGVF